MIAEARTYNQLWAVLRTRAEELGISRENLDAEAGLPAGYSGTLLAPAQVKKMGLSSLGPLLGILRLKLIVAEDDAARPRAAHGADTSRAAAPPIRAPQTRQPPSADTGAGIAPKPPRSPSQRG